MQILVIAAHPDDEVLGCGGTAARFVQEGHTVTPIILCENVSVRYDPNMQGYLEECAMNSAKLLGLSQPIFLRMPDQKLDTYSALEMAQILEKAIREFQPQIVFTHHGGDINKDHQIIFEATLVAARPTPTNGVRTVYTYETVSSTEWATPDYYARFNPNTFFDVSATIEPKLEAFKQYTSELREYPHPRSLEGLELRAKDWGARVGMRAAEAFQLIRTLI
ncbi:MAG: PIG-L family deacetylase [Aliifodinibius sp.]|nr:PIG-L family deacetylase [Fodinibius sp.]NIY27706.1 PIG-L family deacetylase [Fodinibius sp.]